MTTIHKSCGVLVADSQALEKLIGETIVTLRHIRTTYLMFVYSRHSATCGAALPAFPYLLRVNEPCPFQAIHGKRQPLSIEVTDSATLNPLDASDGHCPHAVYRLMNAWQENGEYPAVSFGMAHSAKTTMRMAENEIAKLRVSETACAHDSTRPPGRPDPWT